MIGKLKELLRTASGEWVVSFTTKADPREIFDTFQDKDVSIEIKKASKHRSKTANDFCWAMCTDLANAMHIPKEEVYRRAISEVGKFETMHMRAEAIPTFRSIWSQRGIGWFTEVVDYSQIPGCKVVFAYYGSSTYSTDEMSALLDHLKQDMSALGLMIPISKEEEERMMTAWQKAYSKERKSASSADGNSDSKNTTSSEALPTESSQRSTA
jgi:hypothetical protein